MWVRCFACLIALLCLGSISSANVADFEDLTLAGESYWNGSTEPNAGGFASGGAWFNNKYDAQWGSWGGFAYSNITDTTSSGWTAQYNAITGGGQGDSENYAIGYMDTFGPTTPTITLDSAQVIDSFYVTNTNYAYYSMLYGDSFAKKFGGESGDDEDWFLLTITGKNALGQTSGSVNFYLADYRFPENSLDYIVQSWTAIDVSALGVVQSLEFTLNSSDVGGQGMNTPAYFAIDTIVPEPGTIGLVGVGVLMFRLRRKK